MSHFKKPQQLLPFYGNETKSEACPLRCIKARRAPGGANSIARSLHRRSDAAGFMASDSKAGHA